MNTLDGQDHELSILENIYHPPPSREVRQRDLARRAGISLGMTNAIIGKLVRRGLVAMRKVNNRNIRYVVTPSGIEEIARRSYRLLKRTVRNVVVYREALESLVVKTKEQGYEGILLVGKSDVDFILSYLCQKHDVALGRSASRRRSARKQILYSEDLTVDSVEEGAVSLRDILIGL